MATTSIDVTGSPKRRDVHFPSADGVKCAAWLYPSPVASLKHPGPAIVLAHGLGGIKEMGLQNYASLFQSKGYACLAFDYRYFGESEGTPRQLLDINKQLEDWHAAIAYVRSLPEIDAERIGLWGTSFGGGHVISVAAVDLRIKAAISQCPFTSGIHSGLTLGLRPLPKVTFVAIKDWLIGGSEGGIHPIKLAGAPGEAALMNAPDVIDGYLPLLPDDKKDDFKHFVAARIALKILTYYPGWSASKVQCPLFVAVCGQDSVAPPNETLRLTRSAPRGTVTLYKEMGHFSIYVGKDYEIATADYVKFLERHLPVEGSIAKL